MVSLNVRIKVIIRAYIMDSEMPYFLAWSLCIKRLVHHAVYCIIVVSSCRFRAIPIIPFLLYENFLFTCLLSFFLLLSAMKFIECNSNFLLVTSIIILR